MYVTTTVSHFIECVYVRDANKTLLVVIFIITSLYSVNWYFCAEGVDSTVYIVCLCTACQHRSTKEMDLLGHLD